MSRQFDLMISSTEICLEMFFFLIFFQLLGPTTVKKRGKPADLGAKLLLSLLLVT